MLDDPAAREDFKAALALALAHDLYDDPRGGLGPGDELAGVPAVGPYQAQRREGLMQRLQDRAGAVAVLDGGPW